MNLSSIFLDNGNRHYIWQDLTYITKVFLLLSITISAISLLLNATVIATFTYMAYNRLCTIPNLMFCVQAVTDTIVTFTCLFNGMSMYVPETVMALLFFISYDQLLAVFTLLIITLERFMSVMFPLRHRVSVTCHRFLLVTALMYIISLIPAVIYMMESKTWSKRTSGIYHNVMGIILLISLVTVYVLLITSFYAVKRCLDNLIVQHRRKRCIERTKKKQLRIFRILITMCMLYTVSYLPRSLYKFFYLPYHASCNFIHQLIAENIVLLFYFISSTLNPLLTLMCKDEFRRTLLKCLYNCFKRNYQSTYYPVNNVIKPRWTKTI